MSDNLRRAVFLDKDGTIVQNVPYNVDAGLLAWQPGALEAMGTLQGAGFALVLVTNQSGIAHGIFSEAELKAYLAQLRSRLSAHGIELEDALFCTHHPDAALSRYRRFCSCRKPNPGMLTRAASRHGLDLSRSWMVGDLLDDVEAGHRAGCSSVLVHHDGNEAIPAAGIRRPDVIAPSLQEAVGAMTSDLLAAV